MHSFWFSLIRKVTLHLFVKNGLNYFFISSKACTIQTNPIPVTFESHISPRDWMAEGCGGRGTPWKTWQHVYKTATCVTFLLPCCTFHTFLLNVCFLTRSREWSLWCIACGSFFLELKYFYLFIFCNSLFAQSSVFRVRLKISPLPMSIYPRMAKP